MLKILSYPVGFNKVVEYPWVFNNEMSLRHIYNVGITIKALIFDDSFHRVAFADTTLPRQGNNHFSAKHSSNTIRITFSL